MNWMQTHALMVLIRKDTATLKELRPSTVDSNLFSYHLQELKRRGLIISPARGHYQLTAKGMREAGMYSTDEQAEAHNVKGIIMLYARNGDDVLLYKWTRQPYFGHLTLPHDRYNFGDTLESAIETALQDKLGLTREQAKPHYLTSGVLRIYHDDELLSHMATSVYQVDASSITQDVVTRNGIAGWRKMPQDDAMQGLSELIRAIDEGATEPFDLVLSY